jgi:hypothetical protein
VAVSAIKMVIEAKEVRGLVALVDDIECGRLPARLSSLALHAFFVENPHLLMVQNFDEHMQTSLAKRKIELLKRLSISERTPFFSSKLPYLEFRSPAGRWAGMHFLPNSDDPYFLFSFGARSVLKNAAPWFKALKKASVPDTLEEEELSELVLEEEEGALTETLNDDVFALTLPDLIAELEDRIDKPRERNSVLWSPRMWTPSEQARQRGFLASALQPHLDRWKTSGLVLEDLNPSEFEDLVGQVLFSAGLKIHKVREVPQGGRDLIARGTLIPNEEPIEMAVEVKHRRVVDRPEVQLALYQNRAYPALLFVTSGRFTAGVFDEKRREENRFRLFLKDGLAIGDLVRTHFRIDGRPRR